MKLWTRTKKTFPELTIQEIKRIDWTSVTPEDLALATPREIVYFPYSTLENYFVSPERSFDMLSEEQWLKIINRCTNIEHICALCYVLEVAGCSTEFVLKHLDVFRSKRISDDHLLYCNLIKIGSARDVVSNIYSPAYEYDELFKYLKNSNFLYVNENQDTSTIPILLKVQELNALGMDVQFREDEDMSEYLVRESIETARTYVKKDLTWDNIIDTLYSDSELYFELLPILDEIWLQLNPYFYPNPEVLLNPDYPQ